MMKRKLLLVEDEAIIRKALKQLPWADIGVEEIIDAVNGQEGLKKAQELKPQVVVTDINMPFMDGITMAKQVIQSYPAQIIFLTGYNEFNYAKEAIQIKAFDYILKPVDKEVLFPQVENAFQLVEEEELAQQSASDFKKQHLLNRLLFSTIKVPEGEINETFALTNNYQCLFACIESREEQLLQLLPKNVTKLDDDSLFGLLFEEEKADFKEKLPAISSFLEEENGYLVIGETCSSQGIFADKLLEAREKFELARLQCPGIYHVDNVEDFSEISAKLQEIEAKLVEQIKQHRFYQMKEALDSLGEDAAFLSYPFQNLQPFLIKLLFLMIHEGNFGDNEYYTFYDSLKKSAQAGDALKILEELLKEWQKKESQAGQQETLIEKAIGYINAHFADEDLSLQKVAQHIHVSHPYLSNLFKLELGKKYTEYVFEYRMQAAFTLLETTRQSITDIALQTGFNNANYFSSCFKKHCDMTPKQYRETVKNQLK